MFRFIRQNTILPLIVAGLLLVLFISVALVVISTQSSPTSGEGIVKGGPSIAPPLTWQVPNHAFSSEELTAGKDFKVKAIMVSPTSIRFFFTLKLALPDQDATLSQNVVKVTATSTVPGCAGKSGSSTALNTQVQLLGQLGDFEVGVIHVFDWTDRLGQIISLKGQQPATVNTTSTSWELPALQQIDPISHQGFWGLNFYASAPTPNIMFSGPSGLNFDHQAGFFWLDKLENPVYSPPLIFIEVEREDKIIAINQDEYVKIAGPLPQIYNRSDQYPATPTPPGYTPPAVKTYCQ